MAKAKKAPKGKKKRKEKVVDPNTLTEVDKTFFELTIADLNRKLARLRSQNEELQEKNEELTQAGEKNDEDKNDIIVYLKRMLQEKTDEVGELEERIKGMQETRKAETEKFEVKIVEMEQQFRIMHEQLTSENKLLEGKLNALEEFRSQREELMKKFEEQEKEMEQQEKKHTRELYEIERKFIIGKDKLKKEMEARLIQLSSEFHDASELRIAATTQRVIRENIAINNELDSMLKLHKRLYKDYNSLKTKGVNLRHEKELFESERNQALQQTRVQEKLLNKLCDRNDELIVDLSKYKKAEEDAREARKMVRKFERDITNLTFKIRILEQNLHKTNCDNISLQSELGIVKAENDRLDDILMEGVSCIKESLTIATESDTSVRSSKREGLLSTLFALLSKGHEKHVNKPSLETVASIDQAYQVGDLGFIPKLIEPRPSVKTRRNIASQVGESFEDFLKHGAEFFDVFLAKSYVDHSDSDLQSALEEEQEQHEEQQKVEEKKSSVVFFDDAQMPDDLKSDDSVDHDPYANLELVGEGGDAEIYEDPSLPPSLIASVQGSVSSGGGGRRSASGSAGDAAQTSTKTSPQQSASDVTEQPR